MTTVLNRMLAIRAVAAGAYKLSGPCNDCGQEEGLVAFPLPFSVSIAICRRCRFSRTGIEDRRGLVSATATISSPPALPSSVDAREPFPSEVGGFPSEPAEIARPTIDEIRAEIAALDELDRELDRIIDAADQAAEDPPAAEPVDEVEGIFAPWDDDVDDVKRR